MLRNSNEGRLRSDIDSDVQAPTWIQAARTRTEERLRAATVLSDRLVLLREMVRLSGGRIAMDQLTNGFAAIEQGFLGRFGIGVTPDGAAFMMLAPDELEEIDESLSLHFRVDMQDRAGDRAAAPDTFLLRFSLHKSYKSLFQKASARAVMTMPTGAAMLATMPTDPGRACSSNY